LGKEVQAIRDVFSEIDHWRAAGDEIAVARVVRTEGSAPRAPGAAMVVNADGRVAGSVSGGCVEGAVVSEALEVLSHGLPRLIRFGYSDEVGFAVGLTCGGTIDIFVAPAPPALFDALEAAVAADEPVALATVVALTDAEPAEPGSGFVYRPDGALPSNGAAELGASALLRGDGRYEGSLGNDGLDRSVRRDAAGALRSGRSVLRHYGARGEARSEEIAVFIEAFAPPPRMVIFGAVDFTAALLRVAKILGYHVVVCDARATFATSERFPEADEVVVDWPNRYLERVGATLSARDAICVLTHDPKFDLPAIVTALSTRVGYLGAMGSRRTQEERRRRLVEEGVAERDLDRLRAPIGLDLGAATPEETAVAICAEIIALRNARSPVPLRDSSGPIHPELDLALPTRP
jgi:xanthine dehydrogenase accessory factor